MQYQFSFKAHAEAIYHALIEDAFYITMEKSVDNGSAQEAMIRYMDYSILEGSQYGISHFPEKHQYGVSVWSKPLESKLEEEKDTKKKQFLQNHMGIKSLETYDAIVSNMSAAAQGIIDERYWYLSIIGILPKFQNQGLGRELISRVLEETDSKNIPTYLETFTARNISFYERLGYRIATGIQEPTTRAEYWLMTRQPGSLKHTEG